MMLHIRRTSAVALVSLAAAACGGGDGPTETPPVTNTPVVTTVAVTAPADSLVVHSSMQMTATVKDQSGGVMTGQAVSWASSDTAIASVSSTGAVLGRGVGTVTVTASAGNRSGTASLRVRPTPAATIAVSAAAATVQVGDTTVLTAAFEDAEGRPTEGGTVAWSSGDTTVATVSAAGVLTMKRRAAVVVTAAAGALSGSTTITGTDTHPANFVHRVGRNFVLNGELFYFAGNNAEFIGHLPPEPLERALNEMEAMNFRVVRTWAYRDRGSLDGSRPNLGQEWTHVPDMAYYQYWDGAQNKLVYNDGPTRLQQLDRAIARAGANGMRVILTLSNNWASYGGIDQYNIWFGNQYHGDFYTDARTREAFRNYVRHLVNRVNTVTGVRYRDDPTIFSWELSNEPFCFTDNGHPQRQVEFPTGPNCSAATMNAWAAEMSAYIKELDPNHMVSMGNVGFLDRGGSDEYSNAAGDDFEATLRIPTIDFGTFHLYIDNPDRPKDVAWGVQWIEDHVEAARAIGKPVVMEEFGHADWSNRDQVFQAFHDAFVGAGGNGWILWQMMIIRPDGEPYVADVKHQVRYPSTTASLLAELAREMNRQ